MTSAQAQAVQDAARAGGKWLIWLISQTEPGYPGNTVAWAMMVDRAGGTRLPSLLVADTLDELRAMLPAGLTRRDRTIVMPADVVETWD